MWAIAILGAVASVVAFFFYDGRTALSIALGAALGAGNLWAIARIVRGFLAARGARAPWTLMALVKMSALFGIWMLLLATGFVELMPLVIGFGALPIGIVASELFVSVRAPEKN